jgi:anti-sigma factor RsiW
MDHREYIERYLGLQDDDELGSRGRDAIAVHVADCHECRAILETEQAARAMIQENIQMIPASDALKRRIAAALDAEDRAAARRTRLRYFRKPPVWIAAASLAAGLTLFTFNHRAAAPENPAFDAAITSYMASERSFMPTVGAKSTDDLAIALITQFGVAPVWDFSSMGLTSTGARFEKTADGKVVAYSLYKGSKGSLLCIINRNDDFHFPPDDQVVKGVHLYHYKGYSIAATNRYSVFCVMITDLSLDDLARALDRHPA